MNKKILILILTILLIISISIFIYVFNSIEKYLICSIIAEDGNNITIFSFNSMGKCIFSKSMFMYDNVKEIYNEIKNPIIENGIVLSTYYNAKLEGKTLYAESNQYNGLTINEIKEKIKREFNNTIPINENPNHTLNYSFFEL